MVRICTILARRGSQRVPGKNKRVIAGKKLAAWTIELAVTSGLFDLVTVSSDDPDVLDIGSACGAGLLVRRPEDLATSHVRKLPGIVHAIGESERRLGCKASVIVDLDVSSPLRNLDDVKGAIELHSRRNVTNVITGSPSRRSPYFNIVEINEQGFAVVSKPLDGRPLLRQNLPSCYDMNASIYVWSRDPFLADPKTFYPDTLLFEMPEVRSMDIDTELDFELVEHLLRKKIEAT